MQTVTLGRVHTVCTHDTRKPDPETDTAELDRTTTKTKPPLELEYFLGKEKLNNNKFCETL